jgi:hypothetical protein
MHRAHLPVAAIRCKGWRHHGQHWENQQEGRKASPDLANSRDAEVAAHGWRHSATIFLSHPPLARLHELLRSSVELVLVIPRTEIVGLALIDGF